MICTAPKVYRSNDEPGKRDIPTQALIVLAECCHTGTDHLLERTKIKTPYPRR